MTHLQTRRLHAGITPLSPHPEKWAHPRAGGRRTRPQRRRTTVIRKARWHRHPPLIGLLNDAPKLPHRPWLQEDTVSQHGFRSLVIIVVCFRRESDEANVNLFRLKAYETAIPQPIRSVGLTCSPFSITDTHSETTIDRLNRGLGRDVTGSCGLHKPWRASGFGSVQARKLFLHPSREAIHSPDASARRALSSPA